MQSVARAHPTGTVVNPMTPTTLDPVAAAREIAATVTDPEMPMLSLVDLGVLRDVHHDARGRPSWSRHPDLFRLPRTGHHARRPDAARCAQPDS